MKKLIVPTKDKKPLKEHFFPNMDKKDPNHEKNVEAILKYKKTQPGLYAAIKFWD